MRRLATLLLLAACSGERQASSVGFDTLPSGTVVVTNSAPTRWADTSGWKLVLERTVQPPEGDSAAFGDPYDIVLRPDGSFLLRDGSDPALAFYGSDGTLIRRFGRQGGGPGEFERSYPAWLGDTLVVHDPGQSRISLFALDGTLIRSFPGICCHEGPPIGVDTRGRIRVTGQRVSDSAFTNQWLYFSLDGRRVDSMIPPEAGKQKYWQRTANGASTRVNVPFAGQNSQAFLPDGRIVYGMTDRYELLITGTGKDTSRIIRRSGVTGDPVPAGAVDSILGVWTKGNPWLADVAHRSDVPSVRPLWSGLELDGDGNLWVQRGDYTGGSHRFDVFDPEGRFLGEVPAPFDHLWQSVWAGKRVAVLDEDEAGLPRVRVFRIETNR